MNVGTTKDEIYFVISEKDLQIIEETLGRPPRGVQKVCLRDQMGVPVVVTVDPLVDGRPFPTYYWLVHKKLIKEISKIESHSFIKYLERDVILNNTQLRDRLHKDTDRYKKQRWKALASLHEFSSIKEKYRNVLKTVGIGGIKDTTKVRCLHMHYAHYLVDGNIIGQILEEEFTLSRWTIS